MCFNTLPLSMSEQQQPLTIQDTIDLAVRHHKEGRLAEAETIYQQILHKNPNEPVSLHNLGLIAHESANYEKAIELLKKAVANKPDFTDAYNDLGVVLSHLGKTEEAAANFRTTLTINPEHGQAYVNLVRMQQKSGELDPKASSLIDEGYMRIKRCKHGVMLYNVNDVYIGRSLDLYGEFSEEEFTFIRQFLKPGMVCCDLGANIGCHTIFMAKAIGPKGRVIAVEPNRIIFQTLCANVAVNALTNVDTHHKAVGAQVGQIFVPEIRFAVGGNFGGVSLTTIDHGEKIAVTTLDSLDLEYCHFIKIDIEGMESSALRGARETINKFKPTLYVENDRPETSNELIQLLFSMDYRLFWHRPPLFNPHNFFNYPGNIFQSIISINMLCIPKDSSINISGMQEVTGTEPR